MLFIYHSTVTCSLSSGADPGFFLGGGALVSCSTSTTIHHIVSFFCRIPVVLENPRSTRGGGGPTRCTLPPRSAPDPALVTCDLHLFTAYWIAVELA